MPDFTLEKKLHARYGHGSLVIGIDEAGVSRLPALDARGIAAATVAAASSRIGDGLSTYRDGVLSRVNASAAALGAVPGMTAEAFVARVIACHKERDESSSGGQG